MPKLPELIADYAARMHRQVSGHHVLSPLGAWLLLALVGPATRGTHREELEAVLGIDADTAFAQASTLLREQHPAVAAATACWHLSAVDTAALAAWLETLPASTEQGDLPSQDQADAWAERVTDGLITRFPLKMTRDLVLVLATALATRISWQRPFELTDAADLGPVWGTEVQQVLRSVPTHRASVADTEAAGRVGVHVAGSLDGLDVVSVVAGESVPPGSVIAAAHEIAAGNVPEVALGDLPLGDGHAWKVTERVAGPGREDQEEKRYALIPAWHATTELDLAATDLGFGIAAEALMALLPPGHYDHGAVQSAVASYKREGFEAAAITGLYIRASARRPQPRVRDLEVRFVRPYAVVAVTRGRRNGGDPWHDPWWGMPVFSAWVERADNAS
ncbi:MAG TPA: serpin family protein [Frankiaceae bacterium]|nr:serpin family protein [Frankiaceae bacterium]